MTGAETTLPPCAPGATDAPDLPDLPGPAPGARGGALDGPAARGVAIGVFLLAAAALGWFHRDDIFPPEAALTDDPAAACIAKRWAGIDAMAADGTIDAARAKLFKARAEAWCRSRTDQR